jgi:hypothetical protein
VVVRYRSWPHASCRLSAVAALPERGTHSVKSHEWKEEVWGGVVTYPDLQTYRLPSAGNSDHLASEPHADRGLVVRRRLTIQEKGEQVRFSHISSSSSSSPFDTHTTKKYLVHLLAEV